MVITARCVKNWAGADESEREATCGRWGGRFESVQTEGKSRDVTDEAGRGAPAGIARYHLPGSIESKEAEPW